MLTRPLSFLLCATSVAAMLGGCDAVASGRRTAENLYARIRNHDCLAFYDLWQLAEKRDKYAASTLGLVLQKGMARECRPDAILALRAYEPAMGKLQEADFNAGLLYIETKDYPRAEQALLRAAGGEKKGGLTRAMVRLAQLYEAGLAGLPHSQALAVQYYEKASEAGDLYARTKLARMLLAGQGREHDPARAAALLEQAAVLGSVEARLLLASLAAQGGVDGQPNPEVAAKWLGAAALGEPSLTRSYQEHLAHMSPEQQRLVRDEVAQFANNLTKTYVPDAYTSPIEPETRP